MDLEGSGGGLIEVLSQHVLGGTYETHEDRWCHSPESNRTPVEFKSKAVPLYHPVYLVELYLSVVLIQHSGYTARTVKYRKMMRASVGHIAITTATYVHSCISNLSRDNRTGLDPCTCT
jgi:hypothetical protein